MTLLPSSSTKLFEVPVTLAQRTVSCGRWSALGCQRRYLYFVVMVKQSVWLVCVCVFRPGNKFFSRLAWYHLGQIVKSNLWIKLYDHRRKHVRCQSGWCDLEWGCLTTQAGDRSVQLALINGACTILNETVRWVMLPDVSADCIRTRELHRIEWIGTSLADSRPVDIVTLITF